MSVWYLYYFVPVVGSFMSVCILVSPHVMVMKSLANYPQERREMDTFESSP